MECDSDTSGIKSIKADRFAFDSGKDITIYEYTHKVVLK